MQHFEIFDIPVLFILALFWLFLFGFENFYTRVTAMVHGFGTTQNKISVFVDWLSLTVFIYYIIHFNSN
jgi:hypothetical protein